MKECNHNPNDKKNTFRELGLQVMTCPRIFYSQCTVCGELFEYQQMPNGRYKLVKTAKKRGSEQNKLASDTNTEKGGEENVDDGRYSERAE